jgi:hypothetical protein
MRKLALFLVLAAPCRAAQPPAQVESPDGRLTLEDTNDPFTIQWRARHCSERGDSAKRYRSESAAFDLLPCLSHPDSGVRWQTLRALDNGEYFRRPDFEKTILPKLRLAVAYSSQDQDLDVRHSAGDLSRDIQTWEATESPQAKAGAAQFRKDERWRALRRLLRPDADLALVYFCALVFIVLLATGALRRL